MSVNVQSELKVFGESLEWYWRMKAKFRILKEFVSACRDFCQEANERPEYLDYSNFSKIINGNTQRNFGHPDNPRGLLWIVATLMRGDTRRADPISAIPTMGVLLDFLSKVPKHLASNAGRTRIATEAPTTLKRIGIPWNVLEMNTGAQSVPDARYQWRIRETDELDELVPKRERKLFKGEELMLQEFHSLLEETTRETGPLRPVVSKMAIAMILQYSE